MSTTAMTLKAAAALAIGFMAAGCTSTAVMGDTYRVAFGTFNLISNGHEIEVGNGPAKRHAMLEVRSMVDQKLYSGRVGNDDRFAMALPVGEYVIETIGFEHHKEMIESPANFRFSVPSDYESVYVGSVTLEATLESGIYGVVGTADRYTVNNHCSDGCDDTLTTLGLGQSTSGISLMSWDYQMAANQQ